MTLHERAAAIAAAPWAYSSRDISDIINDLLRALAAANQENRK